MNTIETIRAEIERRITDENKLIWNAKKRGTYPSASSIAIIGALTSFRDFLDTLPEQPASEGLYEEVNRYYSDNFAYLTSDQPTLSIIANIARHFAEWGAEHLKK